jgi:uncharacterized lipoprotein YbaY
MNLQINLPQEESLEVKRSSAEIGDGFTRFIVDQAIESSSQPIEFDLSHDEILI